LHWVLQQMEHDGVAPNEVSYGLALEVRRQASGSVQHHTPPTCFHPSKALAPLALRLLGKSFAANAYDYQMRMPGTVLHKAMGS